MTTQPITLKPSAFIIRMLIIEHTSSSLELWKSGRRTPSIAKGRHALTYIARKELKLSYPEIAELCKWKSPKSACEAMKYLMKSKDKSTIEFAEAIYAKAMKGCAA